MFRYPCDALIGVALTCGLVVGCSGGEQSAPKDPTSTEARSTLARDRAPTVADADFQALVDGNTTFALDLYAKVADGTHNCFYSPLSVSAALAMTWAGARGTTQSQMAQTLQFSLAPERIHPAFDKLLLELEARNLAPRQTQEGTKEIVLRPTNAIWAQKDYALVPTYLDTLAVNYDAGVKLLDFVADPPGATHTINAWVADQTEDKIKDLIPDGAITAATRLVLTNTLYFHGNWASVFDKQLTRDGTFHALAADVTAPTMHSELTTQYSHGDGWQMADLPYEDGKLAMTIVLPDSGRFDEVRSGMTGAWLKSSVAQMTPTEMTVAVPKFRFTWGTASLRTALEGLGMTDAFDPAHSDFTGISAAGDLSIDDVLHQAFVGVDESGTEAAAATAILMVGAAMPQNSLVVDRPFVFFIRDTVTGTLLFVGQVVDPTAS